MPDVLSIRGSACLTCLGDSPEAHERAIGSRASGMRPLAELSGAPAGFDDVVAGWIEPRSLLVHRIWTPLSMAALHVTRRALAEAGWNDVSDVPVFFATSRGTLAGVREPWPGRRPTALMAAANSLPAEPAAAISAELGITAPWQVVSSGCCSGLDALHLASLWLKAGEASRALVVAADLPLVSGILEDYDRSGILARGHHPGMHPSEGAAAVCLERAESSTGHPELTSMISLAEPEARFGGNRPLPRLAKALQDMGTTLGTPDVIVPHASGTELHRQHENEALLQAFGAGGERVVLKPLTGHCVGASALIELVLGARILVTRPQSSSLLKVASALGGKHTCAWLHLP